MALANRLGFLYLAIALLLCTSRPPAHNQARVWQFSRGAIADDSGHPLRLRRCKLYRIDEFFVGRVAYTRDPLCFFGGVLSRMLTAIRLALFADSRFGLVPQKSLQSGARGCAVGGYDRTYGAPEHRTRFARAIIAKPISLRRSAAEVAHPVICRGNAD